MNRDNGRVDIRCFTLLPAVPSYASTMKNSSNSYLSAARSNRDDDDDEDDEEEERRKIIQDEADNSFSKWQCVKLF